MTWAVFVLALLGGIATVRSHVSQEDIGYEKMWEDSPKNVEWDCWQQPKLPQWLSGSFILPSVAQFSMGGLEFQGVLDGYGKLHRFQLSDGQVCFRAQMMLTDFYNQSVKTGTVPPAMLFEETKPPRTNCHLPLCNIRGANDNTFVNTILIGGEYSTWTDSTIASALDPYTLSVQGGYAWSDNLMMDHPGHLGALASAHPLRRQQGKGDWVSLQINPAMVPKVGLGAYVDVLTISDSDPHKRKKLTSSKKLPAAPYFHSFGVTDDYVVLPYTPMTFELFSGMENKPMIDAFAQTHPLATTFRAYPFAGGEPLEFTAPEPFTFNHIVNAYQNETAIVFDTNAFSDARLWITDGPARKPVQTNKTARDALRQRPGMQTIWRYALHLSGPNKGSVTSENLGGGRITEFPKININFSGKKHCFYYAQEWFHNNREFASMAVLQHNVCKGTRKYWYRSSHFPSEPFFIPRPGSEDEDDGVVVFSVTDGLSGNSSFIVADGSTMETLVEQLLPVRITFTTHGEWFNGLVGKTKSERSPALAATAFV